MKRNLHRISCTGPSTDILAKGSCTAAYKGDPVKQILHAIFYGDLHNGNLQNLSLSLCRASLSAAVLWAPKRSQITLQCKPSARRAEKPWLCRIYVPWYLFVMFVATLFGASCRGIFVQTIQKMCLIVGSLCWLYVFDYVIDMLSNCFFQFNRVNSQNPDLWFIQ